MTFFEHLAAKLKSENLPDCGVAAVEVGDSWVIVAYNVDGRIAYHRTQGETFPTSAPFKSYEGNGWPLDREIAQDLNDFLESLWVSLPCH